MPSFLCPCCQHNDPASAVAAFLISFSLTMPSLYACFPPPSLQLWLSPPPSPPAPSLSVQYERSLLQIVGVAFVLLGHVASLQGMFDRSEILLPLSLHPIRQQPKFWHAVFIVFVNGKLPLPAPAGRLLFVDSTIVP